MGLRVGRAPRLAHGGEPRARRREARARRPRGAPGRGGGLPLGEAAVRIGLVSDTHGLLDPRAPRALRALRRHPPRRRRREGGGARGARAARAGHRGAREQRRRARRSRGCPRPRSCRSAPLTALVVHDLGPRERPKPPARALLARRRPEIVVHGHSHRPGRRSSRDALREPRERRAAPLLAAARRGGCSPCAGAARASSSSTSPARGRRRSAQPLEVAL